MNRYLSLILAVVCLPALLCAEVKVFNNPREKNWIDQDTYFTYEFSKRPAIGLLVVKIKVFDRTNTQKSDFLIQGVSGMPSMGTAHDSPLTSFKQSRKGDYLLPVNIVMLGTWEVRVRFIKRKKERYAGSIRFDVK